MRLFEITKTPVEQAIDYIYDNFYVYGWKNIGSEQADITIEEAKDKYRIRLWIDSGRLGVGVDPDHGSGSTMKRAKAIQQELQATTGIRESQEETLQARKGRRAEIFIAWLEQQEIPPDYDFEMLKAACLNNVSDVPVNKIIDVAKDTCLQYLDDREMARDAGIIGG